MPGASMGMQMPQGQNPMGQNPMGQMPINTQPSMIQQQIFQALSQSHRNLAGWQAATGMNERTQAVFEMYASSPRMSPPKPWLTHAQMDRNPTLTARDFTT